ncbi:hypothetical protein FM042_03920 [Aliidiomarina halalkaliphila]|uniref:Lipoprotein n=1 Tax=Aliidiomarina halalkaliphila TaxID=2593535 RepID=A0A552X4Q9_9GAMM|nr:hypothetical protein [Aliidiomarina halalkaliphila]TRW50008.1 hypothetical protein FM042_03920 [Aliidiomarina halalkaliphila]
MRYSKFMPTSTAIATVAFALLLAGCAPDNTYHGDEPEIKIDQDEATEEQGIIRDDFTKEELEALRTQVKYIIGVPEASDPSQCRVMPFGAKPCGGPAQYLIYSTKVTDPDVIEPLIMRYNEWSAIYNQREGLMSDCAIVPPISATVVDGVCVASGDTELQ